jgi:E3 ubiquitin-protein ligase UBR4
MAVLMELALVDGVDKVTNTLQSCSENSILELPMVSGDCCGIELDDHIKCSLQGILSSMQLYIYILILSDALILY